MDTNILVLVVDDDRLGRIGLQGALSIMGVKNVVCCVNGKLALDHLFNNKVDLVITDRMMPEMDGIELTKRIRADHLLSDIPVIMISGHSGSEFPRAAGVNEYLLKPVTVQALRSAIEHFFP